MMITNDRVCKVNTEKRDLRLHMMTATLFYADDDLGDSEYNIF